MSLLKKKKKMKNKTMKNLKLFEELFNSHITNFKINDYENEIELEDLIKIKSKYVNVRFNDNELDILNKLFKNRGDIYEYSFNLKRKGFGKYSIVVNGKIEKFKNIDDDIIYTIIGYITIGNSNKSTVLKFESVDEIIEFFQNLIREND